MFRLHFSHLVRHLLSKPIQDGYTGKSIQFNLQGNVGLVSKFGKYYKTVDPGLFEINIFAEEVRSVNIKLRVEDIPSQVITTRDNVTVMIDSVLYWHIIDPRLAIYSVDDVRAALIERTQTTLRQIMGQKTLQQGIELRATIAAEIQSIIGPAAKDWGIRVESILIKVCNRFVLFS
jgi:erythrocyte band 7 integral membrane protein